MPNIIYTKKARKSIKSLDVRVKDRVKAGIEKFVEEDAALPDEVEAIREARQEIERGELYSHEEVWG